MNILNDKLGITGDIKSLRSNDILAEFLEQVKLIRTQLGKQAYLLDNFTVEIIADGRHLPDSLLEMVYKFIGPKRTALITDSMRGAGMPDGESILGSLTNGIKVIIEDNVAKLPDREAFAGSVATCDRLVRTMIHAGVPLSQAVYMVTKVPSDIVGRNIINSNVCIGADADLVMFDNEINIYMTMVNGKIVYESESKK
jgi:N-acetylglucosamine-6-phosphate deacetylase